MPRSNIDKQALEKFRWFCQHSTLHGFFYFSRRHHWVVYVTWTAIIAFSFSLCCFLSHMIWLKFSIDPTFTVVESTHYSTTNIPFPAVTVCDTEPVYGPNTHNITNILKQRFFNAHQIEDFYNSFTDVQKLDYHPPEYVKKMHKVLQDLGLTETNLLQMFAKPCDVLIAVCEWRGKEHNCSEMFHQEYTFRGYCCQFNMEYFMNHADPSTDFMSGVQMNEALGLVVNGKKVSFKGTTAEGYVSLYSYDDKTTMTIVDSATTLTPGGLFDINVYLWVIDSSDDVKMLSLKSRKCVLPSDDVKTGIYYQECMAILILRKVVSVCRCLPFHYTATKLRVDDYSRCTWERMMCIYQQMAKAKSNINDLISDNVCMQRCDYVQYETEIEYIDQNRNRRYANDSFSKVKIHFSSLTCFKYRREVLYSWDQMIANLGGIFGLCLGGSIISIIELIFFTIDFTITLLTSARNKKVMPAKKHVFTLSERDLVSKLPKGGKTGTYRYIH